MDENKKFLSEIIRRGLFEKKMKQSELAVKLNISRNALAQWVNGRNIPPGDKLLQLAKELDIVGELFPGYKKENEVKHVDIEEMRSRLIEVEKCLGLRNLAIRK